MMDFQTLSWVHQTVKLQYEANVAEKAALNGGLQAL